MRYELDTPFNEVANRWANFDPKTATVLIAGRNGVGKSAGINTFKRGSLRVSASPIRRLIKQSSAAGLVSSGTQPDTEEMHFV